MNNLSQTDRQILALVDWNKAIPIAIDMVKAFIAKDWEKLFSLAMQLFRLFFQAEQTLAAQASALTKPQLDWSTLLPLILQIIKIIMDLIGEGGGNGGGDKPPIELSDKQISEALAQLAKAARS